MKTSLSSAPFGNMSAIARITLSVIVLTLASMILTVTVHPQGADLVFMQAINNVLIWTVIALAVSTRISASLRKIANDQRNNMTLEEILKGPPNN